MGGASLWLIPPKDDHPFNKSLNELMFDTLFSDFPHEPKNKFTPHVTITSDIDPKLYASSPQEWLDNLQLPDFAPGKNEASVELEQLEAGDQFFKKIYIRAGKDENLLELAAKCREQGAQIAEEDAQKWAQNEFMPHLSLYYGDISKADVQKKMGLIELQLGFEFGSLFACCGGTLALGAKIALVDTSAALEEWKILATRDAPWAMFKMARGLI